MPVRMLNFVKEPPPMKTGKGGGKAITGTEEWEDTILALGAGLKPQEYISISFPAEHRIFKMVKDPLYSFRICIAEKIKKNNLPYDAYIREGVCYIVGRSVIA
jgi:hypothetical protein